ncbi:hypothetical protein DFH29DRAFT_430009 [Suillus ampliporus]|nr:hypothetical protein DFH29DRAFT_430009 [Suillus ampliporus]
MESPQSQFNHSPGALPLPLQDDDTLVDLNHPTKFDSPQPSSDSNPNSRRVTRSQTTGRPTIRWGKHGRGDPPDTPYRGSSASLKRSFDARAVDDETDVEADQDPTYVPSKLLKMEPTVLIPESSPGSIIEDSPQPKEVTPPFEPSDTPMPGEYTFLDASSSSFTSERRGPRIRTAPPIPVPNLTKKSRGRRVPTAGDDVAVEGEVAEGRKGRVYVCKVEDCGKCFSRGEHLKRHIRSIHTHEKPFDCPHPTCDKRFNRNDNLLQHLRVHKGDNSSQTSVDSAHPATAAESATADGGSPEAAQRASSSKTSTARRAVRPARKSKSAASTPPIHPARLAASRAASRNAPLTLPRTYSLPPLPSLAPSYHNPAIAGFMNNTNIAVSSLRTAMDEETDHEQETEGSEDEGHHGRTTHSLSDLRSMYNFRNAFSSAPLVPRKDMTRGNSLPADEHLDSAPVSAGPGPSSSPSPSSMSREGPDDAHKSVPHSPPTVETQSKDNC